jgi:hypothetical protein
VKAVFLFCPLLGEAFCGAWMSSSNEDVRYWHKADIGLRGVNVCFGGKAAIIRT